MSHLIISIKLLLVMGLLSVGFLSLLSYPDLNYIFAQRVLQTWESEKYGIEMKYPPNWEAIETGIADETGELPVGFSPIGKSEPRVGLLVSFLTPENASLEYYTKKNLDRINTPILEDETITILEKNSTVTLGQQPAYKVVYENKFMSSFTNEEVISKYLKIWTVLETEGYTLTYTAENPDKYDEYINSAEKIINSFRFTR